MSIRVSWDCYEVALLFAAYARVASGSDINAEAHQLSKTLRELAIRRGISIDDTYRNLNGMKMQLANVRDIPSICVHADASSCTVPEYADGIKALLDILEDGKQVQTIHVVTSCEKKHFAASVYPYVESISE